MTAKLPPKEKAEQLVDMCMFKQIGEYKIKMCMLHDAKYIASRIIYEILGAIPESVRMIGYGNADMDNPDIKYWIEVKDELHKLD